MPTERCELCLDNPATVTCDRCKRRVCEECCRTKTDHVGSIIYKKMIECAQCEFDPEPLP